MASFTDNIQALTSFTPYVEQQPVETMRAVGMQKQQQYDEGYHKIQTAIDRVAGLDIMKDVDKKYLQSKLNEVGNSLQSVAASDFSNYQLANSTAGMATRIGNDSKVQTAVGSTARVRKQQGIAQAAQIAGKSSIQNQYDLQKQISNYMQDPEAGSAFTGQYSEYIDIGAKLRDVADKVHEVDNSIDDAFQRNADGSHVLDRNGKPVVDLAMLTIKTKGKPASSILNNFYSSLNENDINQLHIDSSYHYRNASPDMLKADAVNASMEKKELLNQTIVDLNAKLATTKGLTAVQQSEIQAQINSMSAMVKSGAVEKELKSTIEKIKANPDEVKYGVYTQKYLTGLAKDLSYESFTQEIKNNPYQQAGMAIKELQFKYDKANQDHAEFEQRLKQDQYQFGLSYGQKERELAQKAAEKSGIPPITTPGQISTAVDKPTLNGLSSEISGIDNSVKELNASYAPHLTNGTLDTPTKKQHYLDYLANAYAKDPSTIDKLNDNNLRDYLRERRVLDIQKAQKQGLYSAAVAETAKFDQFIDKQLSGEKGLPHANNGKGYSAKQLYGFSKDLENFYHTSSSAGGAIGGGGGQTTFDTNGLLKKYRGTPMETMAVLAVRKYKGEPLNEAQNSALKRAQEIKFKFDPAIRKVNDEKLTAQSDFLALRMPEMQTMNGTLSKESKEDMDLIDRLITSKSKDFNTIGIDSKEKKDFDPDVINDLRKDKNVGYTIEKKFDGSANVHITNGKATQIVPLTSSEFSSYFPNYSRSSAVTDIKYAILASPNGTTNLKGGSDPSNGVNAYMSGYDLPNLSRTPLAHLVRLDVEGKPGNNGSANDKFQVRMYVNNNGIWKSEILNTKDYVGEGGLQPIFDNIGPNTVSSLLKK